MKWNKSTRFALYAGLEMARSGGSLVTAGDIAEKYGISANHLAKVLQQLSRAGIVVAVRGVGGGYRLARSPREITLLDIAEIFEGSLDISACVLSDESEPCGQASACRVKRVFDEIEQQAYFTLKSVRLATLAGLPAPTQP